MPEEPPEQEVIGAPLDATIREKVGLGTQLWFARRFANEHGKSLKFVGKWGCWMAWDPKQGLWRRDEAAPWNAVKASVSRLAIEAASHAGADASSGKELLSAAKHFMSRSGMEAALKIARTEPIMAAEPAEWDMHPELLNCANGTIELFSGVLREHRIADRLTKSTHVSYNSYASAPLWQTFLERILPDEPVRRYVQKALGYSLIGSVTEHVFHVAWGVGANGKTVLFNVVARACGDYAVSVPTALFLNRAYGEHPTLFTVLRGARLALASETPEGGKFNEAQLKMLTGSDPITARGMREDYYTFPPSHTLFVSTNHRPRVTDTGLAIWRRIRLVPFTITIPDHEQDKRLQERLLVELPGILHWVVQGAVAYSREGLNPPDAILVATQDYRTDEDELGEFLEGYALGGSTSTIQLHDAYLAWARDAGIDKPMGRRTLTKILCERGWPYDKNTRPTTFGVSPVQIRDRRMTAEEVRPGGLNPTSSVPNRGKSAADPSQSSMGGQDGDATHRP